MLNKEKADKAREVLKPLSIGDFTTWFNSDGIVKMEASMQTLFEYIDQLEQEKNKVNNIIDEVTDTIVSDEKILALTCKHIIKKTDEECEKQNLLCDECIKQYFEKKVGEK